MDANISRYLSFRHFPRFEGDTVTLTGDATIQSYRGNRWVSLSTKEGQPISATQILRRGNGLDFGNLTPEEGIKALIGAELRVSEIRERVGRCYIMFDAYTVGAVDVKAVETNA